MAAPTTVLEQFLAVVNGDPTYGLPDQTLKKEGYRIFCRIVRMYQSQDPRDIKGGLAQIMRPDLVTRHCKTAINKFDADRPKMQRGARKTVGGEKVSNRPEQAWVDQHNVRGLQKWLGELPGYVTGRLPEAHVRETQPQVNPRASRNSTSVSPAEGCTPQHLGSFLWAADDTSNTAPFTPFLPDLSLQGQAEVSSTGQLMLGLDNFLHQDVPMQDVAFGHVPQPAGPALAGIFPSEPAALGSGTLPDMTAGTLQVPGSGSGSLEGLQTQAFQPSLGPMPHRVQPVSPERLAEIEAQLVLEMGELNCPAYPGNTPGVGSPREWWMRYLAMMWQGVEGFNLLRIFGYTLDEMLALPKGFAIAPEAGATVNPRLLQSGPSSMPFA